MNDDTPATPVESPRAPLPPMPPSRQPAIRRRPAPRAPFMPADGGDRIARHGLQPKEPEE